MEKDMNKYIFFGQILPKDESIICKDMKVKFQKTYQGKPFTANIAVTIANSEITAICETDFDLDNFSTLRNFVKGYLQDIMNHISFNTNYPLYVYLNKAILNNEMILNETNLNTGYFNRVGKELDSKEIYLILTDRHQQISTALNDFRLARENAGNTAFFCFRAIEAVRNDFKGKNDKEKWESMRKNLNLTKEYINKFKEKHVDPQRHGVGILETPGEDRQAQLESAWTTINRYFNYCKNNNQKLDEKDFPIL